MKRLIPWKSKQSSANTALWEESWFESFWENPFRSLLSPFLRSITFLLRMSLRTKKKWWYGLKFPA
jgi:hypothetical protein